MIKIGDICPVFFDPIKDKFSRDIDYIQKFHTSDSILIQVFSDNGETVSGTLHDLVNLTSTNISFIEYDVNDSTKMYYCSLPLSDWKESTYDITIIFNIQEEVYKSQTCEPFMVCSSIPFAFGGYTTRIDISHKDNNSAFDNIFWINDEQQVFSIRLEAGFKPSGVSMKVSNEQFRNQFQEIEELYAIPYKTMTLQCGDASGLPYWYAEFINKALCLSQFNIGGIGYVRSEGSTPELSQVLEDSQMFHFSINLEPRFNDVSGIGGRPESASGSSVVGFLIDNPKEGEMLQYKENKAAFVNVDNVEV